MVIGQPQPVLRDLHWLPVCQRIKYKLAMTVYKCLRGLAPTYLADDCLAISAIAGKRHLRSARTGTLWPATAKLLIPSMVVVLGTDSIPVRADRRCHLVAHWGYRWKILKYVCIAQCICVLTRPFLSWAYLKYRHFQYNNKAMYSFSEAV